METKTVTEHRSLPDALRDAARRSIKIGTQNGRRPDDPLRALIPGDGEITVEMSQAVSVVTGTPAHRRPPLGNAVNTAPAARAALRRWAHRVEQKGDR